MSCKFKVGDAVYKNRNNKEDDRISFNKEYTVTKIKPSERYVNKYLVYVITDAGDSFGFYDDDFEYAISHEDICKSVDEILNF